MKEKLYTLKQIADKTGSVYSSAFSSMFSALSAPEPVEKNPVRKYRMRDAVNFIEMRNNAISVLSEYIDSKLTQAQIIDEIYKRTGYMFSQYHLSRLMTNGGMLPRTMTVRIGTKAKPKKLAAKTQVDSSIKKLFCDEAHFHDFRQRFAWCIDRRKRRITGN